MSWSGKCLIRFNRSTPQTWVPCVGEENHPASLAQVFLDRSTSSVLSGVARTGVRTSSRSTAAKPYRQEGPDDHETPGHAAEVSKPFAAIASVQGIGTRQSWRTRQDAGHRHDSHRPLGGRFHERLHGGHELPLPVGARHRIHLQIDLAVQGVVWFPAGACAIGEVVDFFHPSDWSRCHVTSIGYFNRRLK